MIGQPSVFFTDVVQDAIQKKAAPVDEAALAALVQEERDRQEAAKLTASDVLDAGSDILGAIGDLVNPEKEPIDKPASAPTAPTPTPASGIDPKWMIGGGIAAAILLALVWSKN